ncbi:MAG: response regulator [Candidatus Latescibacterota bacterium]|jgi:YesN/AraC family two-component response regulator
MVRILVVDDDSACLDLLCRALVRAGWESVDRATDGVAALARLRDRPYALCILDLRMPGMDGMTVLAHARASQLRTEFVVLTGYGSIDSAVATIKAGAQDYLVKPVRIDHLRAVVARVLRHHLPVSHVLAERMDAFLAAHATQGPLRVQDLCRQFGVSPRYVSRLLRTHLGTTFPQRLAFYRVQQAKQLLSATVLPVTVVARDCGFRDRRRLCEAFTALVGMPPSQYRSMAAGTRS